jgi:hypothetical protein
VQTMNSIGAKIQMTKTEKRKKRRFYPDSVYATCKNMCAA